MWSMYDVRDGITIENDAHAKKIFMKNGNSHLCLLLTIVSSSSGVLSSSLEDTTASSVVDEQVSEVELLVTVFVSNIKSVAVTFELDAVPYPSSIFSRGVDFITLVVSLLNRLDVSSIVLQLDDIITPNFMRP